MAFPLAARHRAVVVALLAFALFACREKQSPRLHTVDGESTVLPRVTYAVAEARAETRTLDVKGKKRSYVLVAPTIVTPEKKLPLVLVFHGDGGGAEGFHRAFPFERASGKDALLAYPEGIGASWDLETKIGNKDILFVETLVGELARTQPIDRARIFAVGYSSGGFFSNVLACHRPKLLRAISSSAGGAPYNQLAKWPNGYPRCPEQAPVATIALHGARDHGVTLDSGRFSAQYWAYVNGCATDAWETTGYGECRAYRGCPAGKAVAFCEIGDLGHWVWDRAAEASWTFFRHVSDLRDSGD
jgi:polyhydroxybutyrate depolymerase